MLTKKESYEAPQCEMPLQDCSCIVCGSSSTSIEKLNEEDYGVL